MSKISKVIFTNGTFDLFHIGHLDILQYCSEFIVSCHDNLVIALDSDEKIKKDKGLNRPIFSLEERKEQVLALVTRFGFTPEIVSFNTNEELYELIKKYKPDVLIKGADWEGNVIGSDIAKETILFPIDSRFSSTKIINRVIQKHLENEFKQEVVKIDPFEREK